MRAPSKELVLGFRERTSPDGACLHTLQRRAFLACLMWRPVPISLGASHPSRCVETLPACVSVRMCVYVHACALNEALLLRCCLHHMQNKDGALLSTGTSSEALAYVCSEAMLGAQHCAPLPPSTPYSCLGRVIVLALNLQFITGR